MQFCSVVSGSSGNCLFVREKDTRLLIDCGLSGKSTKSGLFFNGIDIADIDGVLITHEHIDHTKGIGVLARQYKLDIYVTKKTYQALPSSLGVIPSDKLHFISETPFRIKDISVEPFPISHDAADPHGFQIWGEKKVCIATDTGKITPTLTEALKGSDFAFIESNHDVHMLTHGPYPWNLQQRILSDYGHLPNADAAQLAVFLAQNGTKRIMLGHLSGENNTPELAYKTTHTALCNAGFTAVAKTLEVASRSFPSDLFEIL